jgi:hypothetical protein
VVAPEAQYGIPLSLCLGLTSKPIGKVVEHDFAENCFYSAWDERTQRVEAMAWVWDYPIEDNVWGAGYDRVASRPAKGIEYLSDRPVDTNLRPVFRSQSDLNKFRNMHCPPFGQHPVIDQVWKDIILKFVPASRIQFLPLRLIANGDIFDNFMWVIPFDRKVCIDLERSNITRRLEKPDGTIILAFRTLAHSPNGLGHMHMARDPQLISHMLVSDELKLALSATGESSMFHRPEEVTSFES